ncbi:hypothetical protein Tco_0301386, partial [Tanacetum coccineum]
MQEIMDLKKQNKIQADALSNEKKEKVEQRDHFIRLNLALKSEFGTLNRINTKMRAAYEKKCEWLKRSVGEGKAILQDLTASQKESDALYEERTKEFAALKEQNQQFEAHLLE